MGCKCGARVKASRVRAAKSPVLPEFWAEFWTEDIAAECGDGDGTGRIRPADAAVSGYGADTRTGRDTALRWPPRSNSIRRSNALERMMGKRRQDLLPDVPENRTPSRPPASKASLGNGRGSSDRLGQEDAAIERLVIGAHHRESGVGIEMSRRPDRPAAPSDRAALETAEPFPDLPQSAPDRRKLRLDRGGREGHRRTIRSSRTSAIPTSGRGGEKNYRVHRRR